MPCQALHQEHTKLGFLQLPSTVLQLNTNPARLGIVWSICQKCEGPQSETVCIYPNWMSQCLVWLQKDRDGQNCWVREVQQKAVLVWNTGLRRRILDLLVSAWSCFSGRLYRSQTAILSADTCNSGEGETSWGRTEIEVQGRESALLPEKVLYV